MEIFETGSIMTSARELCQQDSYIELKEYGPLPPCRKTSPLMPPLRMNEYEMMERDKGKYLLYWAAIHQAMADIIPGKTKTSTDLVNNQDCKVPCQYQGSTLPNQDSTQNTLTYNYESTVYNDSVLYEELYSNEITCLVVGAGLGRLVKFCLDAANACTAKHIHVHVHAVDANPLAVECLKKSFAPWIENSTSQDPSGIHRTLPTRVTVHDPFSLFPGMQQLDLPAGLQVLYRKCDLLVSELLGCSGDDEFLPELTATICHLFLNPNKGISIPGKWCTYVAPIQSDSLYSFLSSTGRSFSSTYTVGLPEDCVFMCQPQTLWEGSCYYYKTPNDGDGVWFDWNPFMLKESHKIGIITNKRKIEKQKGGMEEELNNRNQPVNNQKGRKEMAEQKEEGKEKLGEEEVEKRRQRDIEEEVRSRELWDITLGSLEYEFLIHGLIGYFTACLYGNIYIDSRHTSRRNSFHWECFYMPLQDPISVPVGKYRTRHSVMATVQRICGIFKRSSLFGGFGTRLEMGLNPDLPNTSMDTKSDLLSSSGMSPGMSLSLNYQWCVKLYLETRRGFLLERESNTRGDNIYLHHE